MLCISAPSLPTVAEVRGPICLPCAQLCMQSSCLLQVLHLLHVHGLSTLRTSLHRNLKPIKQVLRSVCRQVCGLAALHTKAMQEFAASRQC